MRRTVDLALTLVGALFISCQPAAEPPAGEEEPRPPGETDVEGIEAVAEEFEAADEA